MKKSTTIALLVTFVALCLSAATTLLFVMFSASVSTSAWVCAIGLGVAYFIFATTIVARRFLRGCQESLVVAVASRILNVSIVVASVVVLSIAIFFWESFCEAAIHDAGILMAMFAKLLVVAVLAAYTRILFIIPIVDDETEEPISIAVSFNFTDEPETSEEEGNPESSYEEEVGRGSEDRENLQEAPDNLSGVEGTAAAVADDENE